MTKGLAGGSISVTPEEGTVCETIQHTACTKTLTSKMAATTG